MHAADHRVIDAAPAAHEGFESFLSEVEAEVRAGRGAERALVLAHADRLSPSAAAALTVCMERAVADGMVLALTTTTGGSAPVSTEVATLLDRVGTRTIEVPPLRRRREDLADLIAHFAGGTGTACTSEALQTLVRLRWPRNARELRHVVESARALRPVGPLTVADLPKEIRSGGRRRILTPMEQAEVDTIVEALDNAHGNKRDAAETLGISRSTLYRKMHSYGLDLDRAAF
jgi:transcriptional regulator with AAA-type ATPase domain